MFAKDLGIDLGTANVLVFLNNKGVIINEPSVVAVDTVKNEVIAVGNDAKEMVGRTPNNIVATRPMKGGVIADFKVTQMMLKYFIGKACKKSFFTPKPRVVICVPSGVTQVEKRAVIEAAISGGAKESATYLIEEPMAAAIGAGLRVEEPAGHMVVDIGGGTSEMAVISLGGIVTSKSLRIAGDVLDEHILNYVKKEYNLAIGTSTAEKIKINRACVFNPPSDNIFEVRGRDFITGLPKTIGLSSRDVYDAIKEPVDSIIDSIKFTLEKTPPELSADIMEYGVTLTGGGALIRGLDELITKETGLPVNVASDPLKSVAVGTGLVLSNMGVLKKALLSSYKM